MSKKKRQKPTRRQHLIPASYLKRFTVLGERESPFWVFDIQRRKLRPSNPDATAYQHYFYGRSGIEEKLAYMEGKWAEGLRQVIASKGWHITRGQREVLSDPAPFREMVNCGTVVVEYDRTWHVERMIENALTLMFILADRHWTIWTADESAPDFVCSDSPVCLTWKEIRPDQPPPGFGLRNTWVTLPLSRRMALVGSYEPQAANRDASAADIAWLNSLTTRYATEIYGTDLSAWTA